MTIGIVVFPGSNCDRDVNWALEGCLGIPTRYLWHETTDLKGIDAIVLPGGFSYGDYLRCGAIARFAPVLQSVCDFAKRGGKVLGICNGFQILTELGLLPGALTRNRDLHFICKSVSLSIANNNTDWFKNIRNQDTIALPIAHGEGRYQCSKSTFNELEDNGLIALKYINNPNGSLYDIAGLTNVKGNVFGLMPHPERACDPLLGSLDGQEILKSLIS
ncbi:phosphoribosylformylglycinamidine synthase subunit PurQ [Prochlorococcus sp. MIT 1223]|uniref:phosphoribosylformylglycinamidine synthase subunit PurQ n=1 Tax=Prochlorococcus sp. MIT 1223 TaxID=3096217 RepID=UPI002A75AAFC|nr:phosphoribosylformylglycinamidine synthase subunit PurQ [Prochlorococcus sp. MIT 1223]